MDTMTATPNLLANTDPSNQPMPSPAPHPAMLVLASLAILLPAALVAVTRLPMPVRGVSAIACGLAVLLCGCYLLGQAFEHLALRAAAPQS